MLLIKMAVRNVFRNRRRSIITVAAIAAGIFTLVVVRGMLDGVGRQSELNLINMQYGHFQVFKKGYYEDPSAGLDDSITDPAAVIADLAKIPHVEAEVPRLAVPSLVNFNGDDFPCLAIGIDLARDEDVFKLAPAIVPGEGSYLTPGPHCMIGQRMARTLGAKTGDSIIWQARALGSGEGGAIQAVYLQIQAVLSTGNPAIDGAVVFIPLDYMRQSLLAGPRATSIAVRADDVRRLNQVVSAASALLAPLGLEIKTWQDLGQSFLELHRVKKTANAIMLGVFLFIVAVGIVNTMLMATYERIREIGMFMALGIKKGEIRRLFLIEGAALGLIGSLIGVILASPLMWAAQTYGIPISFFTGGADVDIGYPIRGVMYGEISASLVITAIAVGIALSMLATILPAWRASNLNPTEALRHV